jgi:hypothetical protein
MDESRCAVVSGWPLFILLARAMVFMTAILNLLVCQIEILQGYSFIAHIRQERRVAMQPFCLANKHLGDSDSILQREL